MKWSNTTEPTCSKKIVDSFVRKLGGSTAYSGKTGTMFINDPEGKNIAHEVTEHFGVGLKSLRFKVVTNEM